jgi:hypothetical protein
MIPMLTTDAPSNLIPLEPLKRRRDLLADDFVRWLPALAAARAHERVA